MFAHPRARARLRDWRGRNGGGVPCGSVQLFRSLLFRILTVDDHVACADTSHLSAEKGWPNMKFMEDFAMSRKLKRSHGRPRLIRNSPRDGTGDMRLRISGRRWRKLGVLKTFLINQYIIAMYNFGIRDMDFLRNLYYKPDGK